MRRGTLSEAVLFLNTLLSSNMVCCFEISMRLLFLSHSDGVKAGRRGRRYSTITSLPVTSKSPDAFHGRGESTGIIFLRPVGKDGVAAGDKLGCIRIFEDLDADGTPRPASASFCQSINGETNRPSPIFSLDLAVDKQQIFSGSGDRYVSVWEKEDDNWFRVQKLGPHTGWVRDVLYNEHSGRLHSIGCNCIETWKLSEDGKWEHEKRSQIESSPLDGATLSSDLLCLSSLEDSYFLAGGVDGRLHLWDSLSMSSPVRSIPAHEGRVNAIECGTSGLVFTAGNDGKVKCWTYSTGKRCLEIVSEFQVQQSRVTSLSSVGMGSYDEYLFCGTNLGEVSLLCLKNRHNKVNLVTIFQIPQRPMIHCIYVKTEKEPSLWIGHSNGLSVFALASLTNLESMRSNEGL